MWSPDGYITLSNILAGFFYDSDLIGSASDRPTESAEATESQIDTGIDHIEVQAFMNWLLVIFLRRFSRKLKVCTASGALLKLDYTAYFYSMNSLHEGHLLFEKYEKAFPDTYADRKILSEIRFQIIDVDLGCIKGNLPKDHGYAPLAGMPLCIELGTLPVNASLLTQWLLDKGFDVFDSNYAAGAIGILEGANRGGRPSLKSQIILDFKSTYPHGLRGTPLTKVAEKLGYHRKTVREALMSAGLYRSNSGRKPEHNPQIE
jgi:hypothetical protein